MHAATSGRSSRCDAPSRWPGQCAVCLDWSTQRICRDCVERLAPVQPRCARCGLRTPALVTQCGACLADPLPFTACIVGCDYAFPWDRLIADFKFNGRVELARPLTDRLLQAVRASAPLPALLLPVPLSPQRLAERGYNQAWELTRRLARELGCRAEAQVLLRPLDGPHQATLGLAQRRANLKGAFVATPPRHVSLLGLHVALVDDVMTSGATLREATLALQRAGAGRVDAWVLARTPAAAD